MIASRVLSTLACLLAATSPAVAGAAGTLDPRFGQDGIVPADCSMSCTFQVGCCTFALEADGRIVLAEPAPGASAVRRLSADGAPDPSFVYDGTIAQAIGMPVVVALATGADGRVFAGVRSADASQGGIVVLDATGARDAAWGDDGVLTAALLGGIPADMAVAPDGALLVSVPSPDDPLGVVVRYGPDGVRDDAFSGDGNADVPARASMNPVVFYPYDAPRLTMLPDGAFATETTVFSGGGGYFYDYVRFDASGAVDPSFGAGGHLALVPPSDEQSRALVGPTHALVAGRVAFLGTDVLVYRADLSGNLDPTFGTGGTVTVVVGTDAGANALLEDAQGRPLFAGHFDRGGIGGSSDTAFVARLTAAGAQDADFGEDGIAVVPDMPGLAPAAVVTEMALTSEGDILALTSAGLVRLLGADGAPTTSTSPSSSSTSTTVASTSTTTGARVSTTSTTTLGGGTTTTTTLLPASRRRCRRACADEIRACVLAAQAELDAGGVPRRGRNGTPALRRQCKKAILTECTTASASVCLTSS